MFKKLAIAGTLIVLIVLTVTLGAASTSSAAPRHKALRYRVIGHMKNYDVVRGRHRVLRVRHHQRYVNVNGVRRYRVVKRNHRVVVLTRVVSAAPTAILRGTPVSVGMPSTASSVWIDTPSTAANDGRADTRWAAAGTRSYPQWWTVDLGVPTTVYGVKAAWYGTKRAYRYRIETSLDGVAFTTVADRSRKQTRGTTTDALTVVARYLRVTVVGVSPSGQAASAYEITVNGDAGSTPPPTPEPVPVPTPTETPTPTPTPTATTTPAPAATYNVMNYGAKGDGVTNDAPAFRLAVAAASNAGGGSVYVPAGNYLFTTCDPYNLGVEGGYTPEASYNVTLRDNVRIVGAGTALTTITGSLSKAHPFGADHKTNIGVSHLLITETGGATGVDAVKFLQCSNVTIDDVHAEGLYIGPALYSCTNSVIKNSSATGCDLAFVSGEADVLGYSGRTTNVLITNCIATGNAVNFRVRGTMLSVADPYALRTDAPLRNNGTTISDCTSTAWVNAGYYLTYSDQLVMSNNTDDETTWDSIQVVGVINSEFHQNTGTITQLDQSNPPAGYGSSSGNTVD